MVEEPQKPPQRWDPDQTATWAPPDTAKPTRLEILIVGRHSFVRHPIGDAVSVTIGRSKKVDVRVEEPSVSRQHAILHITKNTKNELISLKVQDVGSANGTRVRGAKLAPNEPTAIDIGEVVDLGKTMLIVQASGSAERPRRRWSHDYFEMRLEEEVARAHAFGRTFAVIRVLLEGREGSSAVEDLLTNSLRPFDLVATYAPGEYEVLLVDAPSHEATKWIDKFRIRLGPAGDRVQLGCAVYPDDALQPEGLVSKAGAPLHATTPDTPRSRVFDDAAMKRLMRLIERIAPSDIGVLILGETGAGKEVIAEELHRRSHRANHPFLRLNCAALSPTLLESELFGHEKGAFTGADRAKLGLLETAEGGTVLLDEVGDLPLTTQVKLLRVIEDRKVLRVGGLVPRTIDVRFLSATTRDVEAATLTGEFRSDLYFRLSGVSLIVPPLRERVDAIERLLRSFATTARRQSGRDDPAVFTADAIELLEGYYWPGNVRELKNVVERAVLLAGDDPIAADHLPVEKLHGGPMGHAQPRRVAAASMTPSSIVSGNEHPMDTEDGTDSTPTREAVASDLKKELENLERQRIVEALEACAGNQTQAAKMLGISRRTLLYRLDLYKIPRPRKSNPPA